MMQSIGDILAGRTSALTAKDLSELFKVSELMIYKQAREGTLPSFRIGTSVRFDPKRVAEWYELQ